MPPNDRDLMRLHIEALFTHDALGRLLRVNEPDGARAPRFFLGKTALGVELRFRDDVDEETKRALTAAASAELVDARAAELPVDPAPYESILARQAPIQRTETGPAFSFPASLARDERVIVMTEA